MNLLTNIFCGTLMVLLLLSNNAAADGLPPCDEIPKLLCCTGRVLEKCLAGCVDYVNQKCPHKLYKFDKIESSTISSQEIQDRIIEPVRHKQQQNFHQVSLPAKTQAAGPRPTGTKPRQFADLPQEGFIEQTGPANSASSVGSSSGSSGKVRSGGDYDQLNPNYPVTEVTDADLSPECGTAHSKPSFSPCLSRKVVDDLFLSCCRQSVPNSCHALCTYEHREHVAAETLIAAVQSDGCDLRYLSAILYCANQNRDNRECCEHLSLSSPSLGVGERCLRFCNIGRSGNTIGTVEKNDLVCLSNWNVVMYCARAGLRTIN